MANQRLVCIKRPEPNLYSTFEEMYLNERLVDVTLFCNDGQIQAHRLVLAACSPYFSNLFEKLSNPFHHPVIVLKDMRLDDVRLILEFMYRGQLAISQDRMNMLLKNAENLQISGLATSNTSEFSIGNQMLQDSNQQPGNNNSNNNNNNNQTGSKMKRIKKGSTNSNNNNNSMPFAKSSTYQAKLLTGAHNSDNTSSQQTMILDGDPINGTTSHQATNSNNSAYYNNNNDTSANTSLRNLTTSGSNPTLHTPSPQSSIHHLQHLPGLDQNQLSNGGHLNGNHHHHHNQHQTSHHQADLPQHAQINNQLQMLSHSLNNNSNNNSRATSSTSHNGHHQLMTSSNNNHLQLHNQLSQHSHSSPNNNDDLESLSGSSSTRGGRGLHTCPVCWKPFREKANLKRHLQIHSQDRVIYPCTECNKTFTWKDNYIRHTKTSHHMNNVRTRK